MAIDEIHKYKDFKKDLKDLKEYLQFGYFPYYFENNETYSIKLEETVNTVIESDLPRSAKYSKIKTISNFNLCI